MAPLTLVRFYLNDGPRWLIKITLKKEGRLGHKKVKK